MFFKINFVTLPMGIFMNRSATHMGVIHSAVFYGGCNLKIIVFHVIFLGEGIDKENYTACGGSLCVGFVF